MRIGVDLACWSHQRGYGRYTRNLLTAVCREPSPHVFVGFVDATVLAANGRMGIPERISLVPVDQTAPATTAAAADSRRSVGDMLRVSRAIWRASVDVVLFPTSYTFVPVIGGARCVVVIHDAIAERLPGLIFPSRTSRLAWTLKTRLACRQADRVVTVSESAGRAIRANLPVPAERLRVIHEAADPVFRPGELAEVERTALLRRYGLPVERPLLLYLGGFSPHKNVAALLNAIAELGNLGPLVHLALVGETTGETFHSCYRQLREQVVAQGLAADVTFTGYIPDGDLVPLLQTSVALALPSRDEGFGLPAVEAMACGTPVIASSGGALPELVGDAGLLVNPDDAAELATAIRRVVTDAPLAAVLRERGLRRAARLSWAAAAAATLAVCEELASGNDSRRRAGPLPNLQPQPEGGALSWRERSPVHV